MAARRPRTATLVTNSRLRAYVQERPSGQITMPDGVVVAGPRRPQFTGNSKPHRKDGAWSWARSPEQIANRIKVGFPDDEFIRISHEAIYQSLYIQGRGARLNASWSGAYAPAGRCVPHGSGRGARPGRTSLPRR